MTNKKLKFMDFCSGIGGGRLGLEKNGFIYEANSIRIDKFNSILPVVFLPS